MEIDMMDPRTSIPQNPNPYLEEIGINSIRSGLALLISAANDKELDKPTNFQCDQCKQYLQYKLCYQSNHKSRQRNKISLSLGCPCGQLDISIYMKGDQHKE